jgi:hypothetical protein
VEKTSLFSPVISALSKNNSSPDISVYRWADYANFGDSGAKKSPKTGGACRQILAVY